MLSSAEKHTIDGSAGRIEFALDWPDDAPPRGIAYVGHPHPLYGGTLDNKVASTMARTFAALGWLSAIGYAATFTLLYGPLRAADRML